MSDAKEIRKLMSMGYASGLLTGCECSSQEELAKAVPDLTLKHFSEMTKDGTLMQCAKHPGRFVLADRGLREALQLVRQDPKLRRKFRC